MNSEFRTKWPRGELGALPDDAEQNMRLNFYERELEKVKVIVDELRFDKPWMTATIVGAVTAAVVSAL